MPATPIYALPYPAAADPADVPLDMQELADRLELMLGGALSVTPPASPSEGQLWWLPVTATTTWQFRYHASSGSSFKWESVNGVPVFAQVLGDETTSGTVYVDLATVGPSVTVPRAGDYLVSFGAFVYNTTATAAAALAVKKGAAAAVDADSIIATSATASAFNSPARTIQALGLAANDVLKLVYKSGSATPAHFDRRWIAVTPLRVS